LGGSGSDIFNAVATDSSGSIYAVGSEKTTNGVDKPLITKWDATGNVIWKRNLDGSFAFKSIAIDASNNIYAVGDDNSVNYPYPSGIITKWDTSGNLIWQKTLSRPSGQWYGIYFNGVAVDTSDNIYVAGVNYDGTYNYVYLTKWSSTGNLTWQRYIGFGNLNFYNVTCDSSGNIYAVGYMFLIGPYDSGSFVTKWDASGNILWQRRLTNNNGNVYDVRLDSSGNVYTCSNSGNGAVIDKWDSSGNQIWQRKIGTSNDGFYGIAIDTSNNIYAVGLHYTTTPVSDPLITKWDASGNFIWQRKLAGSGWDQFNDIAIDSSGNIYAVGNDTSNGSGSDPLIVKWPSDVTNLPDGALAGSGMTTMSITTTSLTVTSPANA
jgi:hypothetical protein